MRIKLDCSGCGKNLGEIEEDTSFESGEQLERIAGLIVYCKDCS